MLVYKFIEKDLHSRRFAWNKLNFLQKLSSSTSPRERINDLFKSSSTSEKCFVECLLPSVIMLSLKNKMIV